MLGFDSVRFSRFGRVLGPLDSPNGGCDILIYIYIYKENFILYKYRNNFLKNNIYFNINDIIKFKNNYINYKSIKIVKNLITQLAPF